MRLYQKYSYCVILNELGRSGIRFAQDGNFLINKCLYRYLFQGFINFIQQVIFWI